MIRQGKSAYLRRALLRLVYGAQAYSPTATLYLGLFSSRHNADGSGGTELSGGGYARKAVTNNTTSFPDPEDHELETGVEIVLDAATADWPRAVAFAWYDQVTGGNQLHFGELLGEPVAVTAHAGTDVLTTASAHGLADSTRVKLYNRDGSLPGGLTEAATYYVRDASSTTLKLAASNGGAAVDLTSAGEGAHYLAEDKSKLVEAGDIARFLAGALKIREY
jgi:hypothetical protein